VNFCAAASPRETVSNKVRTSRNLLMILKKTGSFAKLKNLNNM
jgi:hypothetical protein